MMKVIQALLFPLLVVVVTTLFLYGDENVIQESEVEKSEKNIGDLICGPKCVCEIVRLYGKEEEDVVRLVREIQYPDVRAGATMASVAQALEKRGIHTFAMKIKPSARIVWQYPVIVHLSPKTDNEIGHYVVWLPDSTGNIAKIWNTDEVIRDMNERDWSKERSGVVLLTSPEPIDNPSKAVKWVGMPFYDYGDSILAGVIFIAGLGLTIESFCFHNLFRKGKLP
jgi:ABC-type bacteriocin/lantibiotic exporter with double-glycine peptidase domain